MSLTQRQWTNIDQYTGHIIDFEMEARGWAQVHLLTQVLYPDYDSSDESDENDLAQINQILNNPYLVFQTDRFMRNAQVSEIHRVVHQRIFNHIKNYNANNPGVMPGLDNWLVETEELLGLDNVHPTLDQAPPNNPSPPEEENKLYGATIIIFTLLGGAIAQSERGEEFVEAGMTLGALVGLVVYYLLNEMSTHLVSLLESLEALMFDNDLEQQETVRPYP